MEDIITRGMYELRKAAFGEDAEDLKRLSWTREQAWAVLKQLAKNEEVRFLPFKTNDNLLSRNLGIIS